LLLGESGAGKTSLLHEFRRACAERDNDVLTVNCPQSDDLPAHWPWKQALREAAELRPETVHALPSDIRATIASLVPELAPEPGSGPACVPEPSQFDLHEAVSRALISIARRPLVLILEDLHWADVASLQLLRFLARQLNDSQLLLVVTSRTFRAATDPDMRAALAAVRELPTSDEVALRGLTLEENRELEAVMGHDATDFDLAETVVRLWVGQAEVDASERDGLTSSEREELASLQRENRRLREDVDLLKRATALFAKETQ
jgi:hypothetical protein